MSDSGGIISPKSRRRQSALVSLANKRASIVPNVVNLNFLVKVYLLDGSSKTLQMFNNSTAKDVLVSLRLNLDLHDISTFALFRVVDNNVRRIDLNEKISDVLLDSSGSGKNISILFRSWVHFSKGVFYKDVMQDDDLFPVANSALWLCYSEALFMCVSGKYYLNESEAMFLGCLRAQAESGDFDATKHNLTSMKNRITMRFPEPLSTKMKYLLINDSSAANELAEKAQLIYSRLVGKDRYQSQVEFLRFLQMWSPFYGSTFYHVQCQYDPNPLDSSETSNPPVVPMTAAVGPQAILLLTASESTILRHPYQRIIKWIAHPDKHIFTYWVIKPSVKLSDIEQYQSSSSARSSFDPRPYCDCVYLVTPQVRELEHLVKSYVQCAISGAAPCLPGAPEELRAPDEPDYEELYCQLKESVEANKKGGKAGTQTISDPISASSSSGGGGVRRVSSSPVKMSRLSVFLSALGGTAVAGATTEEEEDGEVVSGSGIGLLREEAEPQEIGGVLSSLFKNMYTQPSSDHQSSKAKQHNSTPDSEVDEDISLRRIPTSVRYASTLAELQKVASEEQFSDDEDEPSDSEGEEQQQAGEVLASSDEEEPESDSEEEKNKTKGSQVKKRRDSALARASRAFFKAVTGEATNKKNKIDSNDEDDDEPEEEDDT